LVARHGCVQVEIFDVCANETGYTSGNDAVEEDFGSGHVGGGSWVVNEVATGPSTAPASNMPLNPAIRPFSLPLTSNKSSRLSAHSYTTHTSSTQPYS
jgi:hypothetical protein